MKIKIFALVLVSVLCSTVTSGQEELIKELPPSWQIEELPPLKAFEKLKPLSKDLINYFDEMMRKKNLCGGVYPIDVDYSLQNSGQWDTLENNDMIWRLAFVASDIKEITLYFCTFIIDDQARFYTYPYNRKYDPCCETNRSNINRKRFVTLMSMMVSDTIVIEYYVPNNAGIGVIKIDRISRSLKEKDLGLKTSSDCTVNVCQEEVINWQLEKNAVAKRDGLYAVLYCHLRKQHNT